MILGQNVAVVDMGVSQIRDPFLDGFNGKPKEKHADPEGSSNLERLPSGLVPQCDSLGAETGSDEKASRVGNDNETGCWE